MKALLPRWMALAAFSLTVSTLVGCSGGFNASKLAWWKTPTAEAETQLAEAESDDDPDGASSEQAAEGEVPVDQIQIAAKAAGLGIDAGEEAGADAMAPAEGAVAPESYPSTSAPSADYALANRPKPEVVAKPVELKPSDEADATQAWESSNSFSVADRRAFDIPTRGDDKQFVPTPAPASNGVNDAPWQGTDATASPWAQPVQGATFIR